MKKILIMLLIATGLSGCASIIKGGNQNINIMTADGKNVNATVFSKAGVMDTELPRLFSVKKDS